MECDERIIGVIDKIREIRAAFLADVEAGMSIDGEGRYGVSLCTFWRAGEYTTVVSAASRDEIYVIVMPIDIDEDGQFGKGYWKGSFDEAMYKLGDVLLRWVADGTGLTSRAAFVVYEMVACGYRWPEMFTKVKASLEDDADWWKK